LHVWTTAHVGRFDLSPPLRPEKGVGGTRALAHLLLLRIQYILNILNILHDHQYCQDY
jgi:hypothetical protein